MRLTDLADIAAAQVPLCPLPLVLLETRWAVREFLEKSRAWTMLIKGTWVENNPVCHMSYPEGTAPYSVYRVLVDGHEIDNLAGEGEIWPKEDILHIKGPAWWRFINDSLEILPVSDVTDENAKERSVEAMMSMTISGKNPDVPDWIKPDEISYGAMGKLFSMSGQTWSNTALGAVYEEKFGQAIAGKRIEKTHAGKPGSLTMHAPFVGGYF